MILKAYMKAHRLTDEKFGALVKRDRLTVFAWRHGKKYPDPKSLREIFAVTNGQVTANDFFHAAVAEAKPEGAAA